MLTFGATGVNAQVAIFKNNTILCGVKPQTASSDLNMIDPCCIETLIQCSVLDQIQIRYNGIPSNQNCYTPCLFIEEKVYNFTDGNSLAGLNDFTTNTTNGFIVAYDSTSSKYVSQNPALINIVTKSDPQLLTGQKQFSGTTTIFSNNLAGQTTSIQSQNVLGDSAVQITSGAYSSYIV